MSRWHLKSHRFPWFATKHLTTKQFCPRAFTYKCRGRNNSCESWHCETTVRTEDAFLDCVIIDKVVLLYQYCSTDTWFNIANLATWWNLQNCFRFCWPGKPTKMKPIFVGDRWLSVGGQQKWNQICFCFCWALPYMGQKQKQKWIITPQFTHFCGFHPPYTNKNKSDLILLAPDW